MPAYQFRLLRLIEAAEHYISLNRQLRNSIRNAYDAIQTRQLTPEDAIKRLFTLLTHAPETNHEIVVNEERVHYQLTHRRNNVERARIQARRAGVPFIPPMAEGVAERTERKYPSARVAKSAKSSYPHEPVITLPESYGELTPDTDPFADTTDPIDLDQMYTPEEHARYAEYLKNKGTK